MSDIRKTFLRRDSTNFHVLSFNTLLQHYIPKVIDAYSTATTLIDKVKYSIKLSDVVTHDPGFSDQDCFDFGFSRVVNICAKITLSRVDMVLEDESKSNVMVPSGPEVCISAADIIVAKLPVCTGRISSLAEFKQDQHKESGIFLIHGKQRTLPPIKAMIYNHALLSEKKDVIVLQVRSAHANKPFRSTSSVDFSLDKTNKKSSTLGTINVKLPFQTSTNLNVGVVAIALGTPILDFIRMVKHLAGPNYSLATFRIYEIAMEFCPQVIKCTTQDEATMYISCMFGKSTLSTGKNVIKSELFPHINAEPGDHTRLKSIFLARCVAQIIMFRHGMVDATRRDHFRNSSTVSGADFVGQLFRLLFINHVRTTGKLLRRAILQIQKTKSNKVIDLAKLFGEPRLSARLLTAVANGCWSQVKKGVWRFLAFIF